ncbi:DUF3307 domain-containing protein [Henriciella barbarensis]|uniref:DUF3307 domain-containing protein n=1 Tax=Henriciella barbarensis TaxID=86342 RepID=A0A399R0Z8_9PROT|nr:DUF3307 domain-containing protein [Henriciella barbarensis]RIJ23547.1 DUF3307 domain-containing protein [Henriciella barbarensis]
MGLGQAGYQTFIVLFAAHLMADFVVQTDIMVENKKKVCVSLLHTGIVLLAVIILSGTLNFFAITIIGVTHYIIDWWKAHQEKFEALNAFSVDQILHVSVLLVVTLLFPRLYEHGIWLDPNSIIPKNFSQATVQVYLKALIGISALILVTKFSGIVVRHFMARFPYNDFGKSLRNAGLYIGYLERLLVLFLFWVGYPSGVGFVFAAKSLLRFNQVRSRKTSEYVLIGSLLSFTLAFAIAWGAQQAVKLIQIP